MSDTIKITIEGTPDQIKQILNLKTETKPYSIPYYPSTSIPYPYAKYEAHGSLPGLKQMVDSGPVSLTMTEQDK